MKLIKESDQPTGCKHCRHYLLRREERFPYVCRAMKYVGRQPPSEIVLDACEGPCPLFEPLASPQP